MFTYLKKFGSSVSGRQFLEISYFENQTYDLDFGDENMHGIRLKTYKFNISVHEDLNDNIFKVIKFI